MQEKSKVISINDIKNIKKRKPRWLRVKLPTGKNYKHVRKLVSEHNLHTICESGNCPNMGECWGEGTATFMILGNICTRSCGFCAVSTGRPLAVDWTEPEKVARSVKLMEVKHCVITSVDRDDLDDGGAQHFANTVNLIRQKSPSTSIEILTPDFLRANSDSLNIVLSSNPNVFNHNLETVPRLYHEVRPGSRYYQSLKILHPMVN